MHDDEEVRARGDGIARLNLALEQSLALSALVHLSALVGNYLPPDNVNSAIFFHVLHHTLSKDSNAPITAVEKEPTTVLTTASVIDQFGVNAFQLQYLSNLQT